MAAVFVLTVHFKEGPCVRNLPDVFDSANGARSYALNYWGTTVRRESPSLWLGTDQKAFTLHIDKRTVFKK